MTPWLPPFLENWWRGTLNLMTCRFNSPAQGSKAVTTNPKTRLSQKVWIRA